MLKMPSPRPSPIGWERENRSLYCRESMVSLVNDHEGAVWFGKGGGQAPDWNAVSPAFFRSRLPVTVVELPRDRAAFSPTGAFGPDQEHFPPYIAHCDWVFGLCGHWRNWLGHFPAFRVHTHKEDFAVGFCGSQHAGTAFR